MKAAGDKASIVLTVNGKQHKLRVNPSKTLLDVLREDLDLTGTKKACDGGECGSCMVLLGKKGVMSCLLPVSRAQGKKIATIEGLAPKFIASARAGSGTIDDLHPIQRAFFELGASQCGFCIPGMIMQACALLESHPDPSREDIEKYLARNICRCTGYTKIIDAVLYGSEMMRGGSRNIIVKPNGNKHWVGEKLVGLDDLAEVTGLAKYGADLKMDGMLYAKILRSTQHHARILSIDTSQAERLPGVKAVVTARDIPGDPSMIVGRPQGELFTKDKVHFLGEAIAAVAATSEEVAQEAVNLIMLEYQPLPPMMTIAEATQQNAPLIRPPEPNVVFARKLVHGDITDGFEAADVIIENRYVTPRWEHFYMEPESGLAYVDKDDQIVLRMASFQPFAAQEFLANMLAVDRSRVRIIAPFMGGNFGGRCDYVHAGAIALLALKTKKPVKIVYTREESLAGSSKWFGFDMQYKTGATKDGKIVALKVDVIADGGNWTHYPGKQVQDTYSRHVFSATGPYCIPNVLIDAQEASTNTPRGLALRGIDALCFAFAMETQMELLAESLGIDPLEIRLKNAFEVGSRTHTGQILEESVGIKDTLEALRAPYKTALALARTNPPPAPWKRGVGIGCGWRSTGSPGSHKGGGEPVVESAAELLENGKVRIYAGAVEKGQGIRTVIAQIAAEQLNLPIHLLDVVMGDTYLAPYPHTTSAQGTTTLVGGAVHDASKNLAAALITTAADILNKEPEDLHLEAGYVCSDQDSERKISFEALVAHMKERGIATRYEGTFSWKNTKPIDPLTGQGSIADVYSYCSALAEVDVNTETGEVKVLRVVYAADAGKIINPLSYEGQCEGGVVFGMSLALKEKFIPGKTRTIKDYGLVSIREAPEKITVIPVEQITSMGPYGAKGGAEMSDVAPVPAIINAIANATGARIYELPATKERVLQAIQKTGK